MGKEKREVEREGTSEPGSRGGERWRGRTAKNWRRD